MGCLTALMTRLGVSLLLLHTLAATKDSIVDDRSLVFEAKNTSDIIISCVFKNKDLPGDLMSLQLLKIGHENTTVILAEMWPQSENQETADSLYLFKDRLRLDGNVGKEMTRLQLTLVDMWPSSLILGRYVCKAYTELDGNVNTSTYDFTVWEDEDKHDNTSFAIQKGLSLTCEDKSRTKQPEMLDDYNIAIEANTPLASKTGSNISCVSSKNMCWSQDFSKHPQLTVHWFTAKPNYREIDCRTPTSNKRLTFDINKGAPGQPFSVFFVAGVVFIMMVSKF